MKDLEGEILDYMKERNWHRVRPSDVAKSIIIEAAELLELFQWSDVTIAKAKKDREKMKQIKKELADVFIYCIEMSVLLGLDTRQIVRDKLELAREKYPAALMRRSGKRYSSGSLGDKAYWRIKERYRKERAQGKGKA